MSPLGDNVEVEADNLWTGGLGFNPSQEGRFLVIGLLSAN